LKSLNSYKLSGNASLLICRSDIRYKRFSRSVTCIVWSSNPLIFAVGYGRYFFTPNNSDGLVYVWNIKNPVLPERTIRLKSPTSACAFSKRHPNLLAIGLISGSMVLVDISTPNCPVIFESQETGDPLWSITWLQMESYGEDEMLLAGTQVFRIPSLGNY